MKIRKMVSDDIFEIVKFDNVIFGESLGKEFLESELKANPMARYYVMTDAQEALMGMISYWISLDQAQINNFYIIPEHQGKGYGKELLSFALKKLKKSDVNEVTLEVRPSNQKANKLYQRFGFKQVAVRRNYYSNGEDALLLYLRIGSEIKCT